MTTPDQILNQLKKDNQDALQALQEQFRKLQIGKATTGLVEDIVVEHYGSHLKIKELANITIPESQQILITPWDKSAVVSIEKAIANSSLGLTPISEATSIRIKIPSLTTERRQDLKKTTSEYAEKFRISLRNHRHEAIKLIKQLEQDKKISEDESHTWQAKVDEQTKKDTAQVDALQKQKDQEITKI